MTSVARVDLGHVVAGGHAPTKVRVCLASAEDRSTIYHMRHEVYGEELQQHKTNREGALTDSLDASNVYIVAKFGSEVAGFVSITPPNGPRYSIDKYLARDELPFPCDAGLYEVRLLTVRRNRRGRELAALLMYAALRWIENAGGTRIVAIGRTEVLDLYCKAGLELLGRRVISGAVSYELMAATVEQLTASASRRRGLLRRFEAETDWQLGAAFEPATPCYHGGSFFQAIGEEFDSLERTARIINADVLDAWFPPCPAAVAALRDFLPWLMRTSPPTDCAGLVRALARARGVAPANLAPGSGSSDLIFRAFGAWLTPASRVLLLDPAYGEYAHVTERVIGCRVERLPLAKERGYRLDPDELARKAQQGFDLIVLVNPNSPTGGFLRRKELAPVLGRIPARTLVWVDETYIEYVGTDESLESLAAASENIVVCKSMSKVYALSGLRVAYLCAPPRLARQLRILTPPWAVSLPGQVAAVKALSDPDYYARRYAETHELRAELAAGLRALGGMEVLEGVANFVLCHLSADGPAASEVCWRCETHGLFLRDASSLSLRLGSHVLRIAVKDRPANARILEILGDALRDAAAR